MNGYLLQSDPCESGAIRACHTFSRLLAITGSAPGTNGVGAILQRQIFEEMPRELLRVVTISHRSDVFDSHEWVDADLKRRYEHAYRPLPGLVGEAISLAAHLALSRPHLKKLINECVRHGKDHRCEAVLAVLESPSVILIASKVAEQLGVPLYCFVMDGPNLHIRDFGFDRFKAAELLWAFDSAMHRAERIAVAGEAMQTAYESRYGKRGAILRQGLPYLPPRSETPMSPSLLRIGFAGSLTARDAFEQLLLELGQRDWTIADRKIVIRIVGAHLKLIPTGPQHIEYFGWRMVPDMIRLMEECDFLYMPQPFSSELQEFAELSFPNKLCTYVPARRPIMLHAPSTASLPAFFRRFPCGPRTTELNAGDLVDQVEAAVNDTGRYKDYRKAVELAHREELNAARLRSEARRFLAKENNPLGLEAGA